MNRSIGGRLLLPLLVIVTGYFLFTTPAIAALTLTAGDNATTTPNVATSITGFQIVGPAASTTPVKLLATNGTLSLSSVSGVTMSGNGSGTINLSGTVEKLNTALSTLTYTRASTGTDTLEVSLVEAGEVFFEENGHLYKYIADSGTWSAAKTKAEALDPLYGAAGYLVTVTSAEENAFVTARLANAGWMGASDAASEGAWRWVTGPEGEEDGGNGLQFWSGLSGGSTVGGNYANWGTGEPNDSGGEDCGQYLSGGSGKWNDLPCTGNNLPGYVAEFGAPGALPTVVAQNISIVTADVPALTTLSPANGASSISPSANLVMTFSKTVTKQTGNILIRQSSDDEIVATIDVSGDLVTAAASTTATINPASDLEEGVQYYVTVPGTAFSDSSGNFFNGISDDSTWVFTTSDETAAEISSVSATSTASTTATISWETNEAASRKVVYGLTSSYGTTTAETNTSPRVTEHEVNLSDLLSCTMYHYAVVSTDGASNTATSTDKTFTTTGCTGNATPTTATSTTIHAGNTGTTNVVENAKTFSVTADAPVDSTIVIQVKAVPKSAVLTALGRPSAAPNEVGATVFDVKAIVNGDTIFDSFDTEVTIDYEYTEEEILGTDESSLWLYHYTGGQWVALNDCVLDTDANTISCTTPSFSVFGLFGSGASGSSNGSSGVTLAGRINNLLSSGNISLALELLRDYLRIFFQHQTLASTKTEEVQLETEAVFISAGDDSTVRDLEYGMEGEDVRRLQELLINTNSGPAAEELDRIGATGYFGLSTEYALDEYQVVNNIAPRSGYFGSITRAQMKAAGMEGLWW